MINKNVYLDYDNLSGTFRAKGFNFRLDEELKSFLACPSRGQFLADLTVFCSYPPDVENVFKFHDALRHQGAQVVAKRQKEMPDGKRKGNIDIEMTIAALQVNDMKHAPDVICLMTHDGDFAPLCTRLRNMGFFVEVAGLASSMASDLKAAASAVIDLTDFAADLNSEHGSINVLDKEVVL